MRGIFLIIGESFRTGEQGTRIRGDTCSYKEQMKAINSHIQFMSQFPTVKWIPIIFSYTTKYDKEICKLYHPVFSSFMEYPIGYDELFNTAKEYIITNNIHYDFIFVSRIDLEFKPTFTKIFNPDWKTIRFPFICWKKDSITQDGYPRVSDTMVFIPNHYNLYVITLNHNSWSELCRQCFVYSDIDVMINTYHDSDSSKDKNPLYTIVNRSKTYKWNSPNDVFDKRNHFMQTHKLFLAVGSTPYIISPYW